MRGNPLTQVVVVGGGTAGWLTACHLAKVFGCHQPGAIQVTLIESAHIPTIGVGEGTVPAIRHSLQYLGISETEFIRECDATFKQSIKFIDWMKPQPGQANYYHHVFDYPERGSVKLTPHWLLGPKNNSFVDALTIQGVLCDAGLAPKRITDAEYDGIANYAYHLDAAKFAALLTRHAIEKLGVRHVKADVTDVQLTADGSIAAVVTDCAGLISAGLFVDCTGFQALLIGKALQVEFINKNDVLLADAAVAMQVPYETPDAPIGSSTLAIARDAGWIWDIGLTSRRGTGYVYASQFCTSSQAEQTLRDYVGPAAKQLECRHIPMRVGYRQQFWVKNCVAIGLSQGFVEPLEATGLLVYDATARMLAELLPTDTSLFAPVAQRFNHHVRYAWDKVIDFIKLHYYLSDKDDSEFWCSNRDPSTLSASLQQNLQLWQQQMPSQYDFPSRFEIFNLDNYLYVLYGMRFNTQLKHQQNRHPDSPLVQKAFSLIKQQQQQAKAALLPNRQLLQQIKQYGLQKI